MLLVIGCLVAAVFAALLWRGARLPLRITVQVARVGRRGDGRRGRGLSGQRRAGQVLATGRC